MMSLYATRRRMVIQARGTGAEARRAISRQREVWQRIWNGLVPRGGKQFFLFFACIAGPGVRDLKG